MTLTAPPEDLTAAMDIAEGLRLALRRLLREFRRESHDIGLSKLQLILLAAIREHPGIGVGELARLENLREPTVSPQIKALEAAGIVAREAPNPDDRRRVGLLATEKGRAIIETLRRSRTDWLTRRIAELSPESRRAIRDAIGPLGEIVP
jgi:DNA-binding MarR family transcriptional regulator